MMGKPRWSTSLMAIIACYGVIRIAAMLSAWSFPVVAAATWAYTLIEGLRNQLVVYANI